jgi:membrane protease YdiL (CAAX protease family)
MKTPRIWPVFLGFGLTLALCLVISAVVMVIVAGSGPLPTADTIDAGGLIRGAAITGAVFLVMTVVLSRPLGAARLRLGPARGGGMTWLVAVLGTVALAQILDSLTKLLGLYSGTNLARFDQALAGLNGPRLWLALLLIGPLTGLAEELFFRGFMQTRLAERWRSWTAVLVTSLCFGLTHMDPVHSLVAFCLGLWLGFVTERAQSLWPAIVAHAINNTLATAQPAMGLTTEQTTPVLALGGLGVLVLMVCARQMAQVRPVTAAAPLVTGQALPVQ